MKPFLLLASLAMLITGCRTMEKEVNIDNMKFERLFSWGPPTNEETAEKYAKAGVTDIIVYSKKQLELATKHGMRGYWTCFTPDGPHCQVMSEEETNHFNYINGKDLDPKMPREERMKITSKRKGEKNHRYGGEMVTDIDTLNDAEIKCFISDDDLALTKKKLDRILSTAPAGISGIYIDYVGYMNHNGCYCENCLEKYRKYLSEHKLEDTPKNKNDFYLGQLVDYYNNVIDYIKKQRPEFKVVVHVYPDFKPLPLLGNRIKADFCGQTVAWYFQWPKEKIQRYTKYVTEHAKDYYPNVEGIPFQGINTNPNISLGYKTPADVEREIRQILTAGGRTLMVCDGPSIIEPSYYEIFRKYCGKE